jgi:hypothetical protein
MKKIIISIILLLNIQFSCNTQTINQMEDKNLKFYPFDGYYVDLEKLQRIEIDGILPTNFKSLSIYAFRFYAPEQWINNFYKECSFNNCLFKIEKDQSISIKDRNTSKVITVNNPDKDIAVENVTGAHFLFSTSNGVIEIKSLEGKNGYQVRNYIESGKCKYSLNIEHTKIEVKGNTNYHKPYLSYYTCTDKYLIFTSYNREFPKTVQVNLADGKVTNYNFTINGVIRTDMEENIPGFICIDENKKSFKTIILNHTWTASPDNLWANTAETVLIDNTIYIAFYHGIATGSSLYAFDIISGKELWKADVKQLNVDHSEYYNKVYLSAYKNRIIMEGIEAEGKYLQIFDSKSGERIYSSIP